MHSINVRYLLYLLDAVGPVTGSISGLCIKFACIFTRTVVGFFFVNSLDA